MTSRSHQGLVRLNNEDCVHCDTQGRFVVLADGMGGLLAGEVASAVAVDAACRGLRSPDCTRGKSEELDEILSNAHDAVMARARSMRYVGKMGTTLVVWAQSRAVAQQNAAPVSYFGHVGDSRLYTYAAGRLTQVTRDHTLAQQLIDDGKYAADDERVPNRNVLTRAMGLPGAFAADCGEVPPSERILMCSDGLSDLVKAAHIEEIMATDDLDDCANFLLKAALDKGGRDNVTVALVEF